MPIPYGPEGLADIPVTQLPKRDPGHRRHRRTLVGYSTRGEASLNIRVEGIDRTLRILRKIPNETAKEYRKQLRGPLNRIRDDIRNAAPFPARPRGLVMTTVAATEYGRNGLIGIRAGGSKYQPRPGKSSDTARARVVGPRTVISGRAPDRRGGHAWGGIRRDHYPIFPIFFRARPKLLRTLKKAASAMERDINAQLRRGGFGR